MSAFTDLLERQPWRRLYYTRTWKTAKNRVIARDGTRCTFVIDGHRCPVTTRLHVHHQRKLRQIWHEHTAWSSFVRAACDPAILTTVCQKHNNRLDRATSKGGRVASLEPRLTRMGVNARTSPKRPNRFLTAIGRR
jgi:hypothetical protein